LKTGKVYWDIRYRENGIQTCFRIGETDRRTAEKIFHQFCNRQAEGFSNDDPYTAPIVPPGKAAKISDLAKWTRTFAASNKNPKTMAREQIAFDAIIRTLGDIQISDLTSKVIEGYKAARLKTVRPPTVNIEIRILNLALNQAFGLGLIDYSAKNKFKQVRISDPDPKTVINPDEIRSLLAIEDLDFRRFLAVLIYTGCRRNEALGLNWEDVDLVNGQLVVRGEIAKMGKKRTVPINEPLLKFFTEWPGEHNGALFPGYGPNQVSMKFRRLARQLHLKKGVSIHSLRRTFATQLIEEGVDIYAVSRLLGHSSVKVTEGSYVVADPEHFKAAVRRLNFEPTE